MANHDFNYGDQVQIYPDDLEEYEFYCLIAKKMKRYLRTKKFITAHEAYIYMNFRNWNGNFKTMCKQWKKDNSLYGRLKRKIKDKIDSFILNLNCPY